MVLNVIQSPIEKIEAECVDCGICVKECAFLEEYGSPLVQAKGWFAADSKNRNNHFPFECSLCGLCHGVCPKKLDPSAMFLAMRRLLVAENRGHFPAHNTIKAYEKRGHSSLFSWYHFPKNCNSVFFPGCALPGSRLHTVNRLYHILREKNPHMGIVFDCCSKPSHDLGDVDCFTSMFQQLYTLLVRNGVEKVLVACPNCYRIFSEYGGGLNIVSVYEELLSSSRVLIQISSSVTLHDPCGVRFAALVQQSVRDLLRGQGVHIKEMKHKRQTSFCCGEGGSAGFLRADFAEKWTDKRVAEAGDSPIISYCAGCTHFLGRKTATWHLLDLLLDPKKTVAGKAKVSKAPFTYLNRFRLKRKIKKEDAAVSGTRKQLLLVTK